MRRNADIDCTKGLLALGMIFAHVIQFVDNGQSKILQAVSDWGNFVSFSGFVFCFGFASWSAYLSKYNIPWLNVCKTSLKCLFAYLISGIAYRLILFEDSVNFNFFLKIITFRIIPGYSEFLLSFSLILIFSCLVRPIVQIITKNYYFFLISTTIILSITYISQYVFLNSLLFNFLFGGNGWPFPIIQYFPIFLLGIFTARHHHRYDATSLVVSLIGIAVFYGYNFWGVPVRRFPPDTVWIICSSACAFLYYGFGKFVVNYFPLPLKTYVESVGKNVLIYLLISNFLLFTRGHTKIARLNGEETITFFISTIILLAITLNVFNKKLEIQKIGPTS